MPSQKSIPAFKCHRCGDCCQGQGGIIVTSGDIDRLCTHLGMAPEEFAKTYLEQVGDRPRIRAANDWCVFFVKGCSVHPVKPSVCRAWPFFQGNMLDELSWRIAQDACPGINPQVGHAAFVREGLESLQGLNLEHAGEGSPNALNLTRLSKAPEP